MHYTFKEKRKKALKIRSLYNQTDLNDDEFKVELNKVRGQLIVFLFVFFYIYYHFIFKFVNYFYLS